MRTGRLPQTSVCVRMLQLLEAEIVSVRTTMSVASAVIPLPHTSGGLIPDSKAFELLPPKPAQHTVAVVGLFLATPDTV